MKKKNEIRQFIEDARQVPPLLVKLHNKNNAHVNLRGDIDAARWALHFYKCVPWRNAFIILFPPVLWGFVAPALLRLKVIDLSVGSIASIGSVWMMVAAMFINGRHYYLSIWEREVYFSRKLINDAQLLIKYLGVDLKVYAGGFPHEKNLIEMTRLLLKSRGQAVKAAQEEGDDSEQFKDFKSEFDEFYELAEEFALVKKKTKREYIDPQTVGTATVS